ncbi:MAG: NAD(P)H-hydrate dehydratase, partial [Ruminiclostridium sp.]|nr:NAD(P)H-hydrate dehydratase [Ruminiclostridium sp.]
MESFHPLNNTCAVTLRLTGGSTMVEVTASFLGDCLPRRDRNGHKGTYGRVHILAGCVGFTGAPVFASQAAVRTGSGLVFLSVPEEIWPVVAVKSAEAMPSPVPPFPVLLEKMNAADGVLIGPGLGRSRKTDVRTLRLVEQVRAPLVLDADGLNALAEHMEVLSARHGRLTVLTPHDGEFLRLTGGEAMEGL